MILIILYDVVVVLAVIGCVCLVVWLCCLRVLLSFVVVGLFVGVAYLRCFALVSFVSLVAYAVCTLAGW